MHNAITDVMGIRVGHWSHEQAATGCTVVLCGEGGAVAGVDVRGGAPGTRETALLDPTCLVERVHAVCLSGGSAFGLAAADGVMRYLEEQHIGFATGVARVPIVPAAILFDLALGDASVRPDAAAGFAACLAAADGPVAEGSVGAGTGATVGKLHGLAGAMKGGVGTASCRTAEGIVVGALAAVNSLGNVVDPRSGEIVAGARRMGAEGFVDMEATLLGGLPGVQTPLTNTTLGVVATDAALTKAQATKVAQMAQDGVARAIRPAHTPFDGDLVFALSLGEREGDVGQVGALAARVLAEAVVRAVRKARGLHGVQAVRDLE
jgi:L-aminopeptidase/D-esterase-like protein